MLAAIVGVVASVAAWAFLQLIYYAQDWVYTELPDDLGFQATPIWWSLPLLVLAGLLVALAVTGLPGSGGHVPAAGLSTGLTQPVELPGVIVAALASLALGAVVGPEAPLLAIGSGLGLLTIHLLRRDAPNELGALIAASAMFAALAFLFGSTLIAAVILIEAGGLGGRRLPLVLIPGLMAGGIGSLVWIGMGSWTGLDTSNISLEALQLPQYGSPDLTDFLWTVPFAAAVALGAVLIFRLARVLVPLITSRPFLLLPIAGLAISGSAIAFHAATDMSVDEVLFSGEYSIGPLVEDPGAWSLSALTWLIVFKGLAYTISLAGFRGGPVFPAMFLGAAAGLMVAQLPGYELTPAVAVGIGAAIAGVLRLPLTALLIATLLTAGAGLGTGPLVILGVTVAYLVALAIEGAPPSEESGEDSATPSTAPAT